MAPEQQSWLRMCKVPSPLHPLVKDSFLITPLSPATVFCSRRVHLCTVSHDSDKDLPAHVAGRHSADPRRARASPHSGGGCFHTPLLPTVLHDSYTDQCGCNMAAVLLLTNAYLYDSTSPVLTKGIQYRRWERCWSVCGSVCMVPPSLSLVHARDQALKRRDGLNLCPDPLDPTRSGKPKRLTPHRVAFKLLL